VFPVVQLHTPKLVTERRLSAADLEKLGALDTCTVSNAIERLNVRLRNEGFIAGGVRCRFPDLPPMIGFAATARIRTSSPPMTGRRCYHDRMDWWTYLASVPAPRVMVLEDMDHHPGVGAFVGEIHAAIGRALRCNGCVTNGAVRDLPAVRAMNFPLFSGSVAVSHAYAHIIEFGEPVEIGGLKIQSRDLVHGDRHGVQTIPLEIAAMVPAEAADILAGEHELVAFCNSSDFSLAELSNRLGACSAYCDIPWRQS
jgi:4-hydroxy-4-methyl-2-oxoglutarate aldolase